MTQHYSRCLHIWRLHYVPLCIVLLILPADGITMRWPLHSNDVAEKLKRLLADVDESIQKSGEDEELTFTQLYEYDQALKTSVAHELKYLNKTRGQLHSLYSKYSLEANQSKLESQRLNQLLHQSNKLQGRQQRHLSHANSDLKLKLDHARHLVAALRKGTLSLSKDASRTILSEFQQLLHSNDDLRPRFQDVFAVFADSDSIMETALSPGLLKRATSFVEELGRRLRKHQAKSLLQLQALQEKSSTMMSEGEARASAALGARVDGERKVEELTFSVAFADAAMKNDERFYSRIQKHIQAKAEFVEAIRNDRQNQQTTISDLVDLLKGTYSVPVSLLQKSDQIQSGVQAERELRTTALQADIENAIRRKADTHAILLRVKARLGQAVPIDVGNVRDVVANLGRALHAVDSEQVSADDARRRCEAQEFRSQNEKQRLRSSLKAVAASQNHTGAAMLSARKNLNAVLAKERILNASSQNFSHLEGQASNVFEKQARDRATIMAALHKAEDLIPRAVSPEAAPGAKALVRQLLDQFQAQVNNERGYKTQQHSLQTDLSEYRASYSRLLTDQRSHYEAALSALGLYASELAGDELSRSGILNNDDELQAEGQELCDSILGFYKRHDARRLKLSNALRAVLPKVPQILSSSSDSDEFESRRDS